jgi:zinc/manganese transport system substrate-binding protein
MKHLLAAFATVTLCAVAQAAPVPVVAAENFYGGVVEQLGGSHVAVTSILSNPDQDPHLFEASPSTARALSAARLVIYNGAAYDTWIDKLLAASPSPGRSALVAATLIDKKDGDNPHLWYAPQTMPAVAKAITAFLKKTDPANQADYDSRLSQFLVSLEPLQAKIAALRAKYDGIPVTSTEPVFGYMAEALGLAMRNLPLQIATMNDTEPSAANIAAFENDLRGHHVKVLIYNSQASDQLTRRMLALARTSGIPVVEVTETQPAGKNYEQWMVAQLDALGDALQQGAAK